MMKIKTILTLIFVLNIFVAFAHKDRVEMPKIYLFVFQNQETIRLNRPSEAVLKTYSDDIVNGKRKLVSAELIFKTGERMSFKNDGKKWTEIKITKGKKTISVPDTTMEKISEIHFATIALLWDGNDKHAFSASYFYIRFDLGTEKSYDKYPYLELMFSENTFEKAIVVRPVSENSVQDTDL